nr:reverse transcriptase domain-containing protein [Tanacetum cinerariifolium]
MKYQQSTNAFIKEIFIDLKTQLETVAKNHQASIQKLETKFDRLADKQSGRPSGSLPSNTQPNPKGHNSKTYQPPQARNEHVNAVFTRSGKSYNPPVNPNNQQDKSKTPIIFDSDNEDDETTPQPKIQNPKPVKGTPILKPYKPKISYPQHLRKEKMEAQYEKFLDMICTVRINVVHIDFVILEMEEDSKVPVILGRPFLHTADATIVHTDHSALRNLFKKQDAKPRLIRWILLLQEFDIEIKDKKGTKNVAADHMSRIENDELSNDSEVDDNFPGETLMEINTKDEPWFADFANYLVGDITPKGMTY